MRLFFAVDLAAHVRAAAAQAAADLRSRVERTGRVDARWTPPENLHVTLWFLGEVGATGAAALDEACSRPLRVAPFSFELAGSGAFPPSGPPRVVWFGAGEGRDAIAAVHRELARVLVPLGYATERRAFNPHVTVARFRARPAAAVSRSLRAVIAAHDVRAGVTDVSGVTLYESFLSPRGAVYNPRLRVPLER